MAGQCVAECGGYSSLRVECDRDPCLAQGMCRLLDARVGNCAEWCCEGRSGYVFFVVLFFCTGTCALFIMYYLWRLHQSNVAAGVVTENGEIVQTSQEHEMHPAALSRLRQKRQVTLGPELLDAAGPGARP